MEICEVLRCISLLFREQMRIQIDGGVRTIPNKTSLDLVELGIIESFGRDHLVGVVSQDISNTKRVEDYIEELGMMAPGERILWFRNNYPSAPIYKIEAGRIFDKFRKDKMVKNPAVIITGKFDLKWTK